MVLDCMASGLRVHALSLRGGIALRGRDTASAIHVSAVEAPVLNRLYATMINSFQPAEWQTELWASLH